MTVRFVKSWNGYYEGQIVTSPNGGQSEATLIALGYAVADLDGPDNSPVPVFAQTNPLTGGFIFSAFDVGVITPPSDFLFDFSKLPSPLTLYKEPSGAVGWSFDYESLIPATSKAAPLARIIHVAASGGADANTGVGAYVGDFSNAKSSVASAITYANSLAAGCQIIIGPGTYLRGKGWNGSVPTVPLWVRGWSGGVAANRPLMTMCDDLVWALDGTYTNCYKATRSSTLRVIDVAVKDSFGNFTDLTKVASATLCNTTLNSWYTDGTLVYVRRADGAAPTIANTWATMLVDSFTTSTGSQDLYIEGLQLFGGVVTLKTAPTKKACFVDVDFRFQGGEASPSNSVSVLDYDLAVFVRCLATKASSDGFNAHAVGANIPTMLTLECIAFDNGDGLHTSCNGWTTHDGVQAIDVNGFYYRNRGANVIPVNVGTGAWCVGTRAEIGLLQYPSKAPQNYTASNFSKLWLDKTSGALSDGDLTAEDGAAVKVRGHKTSGCRVERLASGGATIIDF